MDACNGTFPFFKPHLYRPYWNRTVIRIYLHRTFTLLTFLSPQAEAEFEYVTEFGIGCEALDLCPPQITKAGQKTFPQVSQTPCDDWKWPILQTMKAI